MAIVASIVVAARRDAAVEPLSFARPAAAYHVEYSVTHAKAHAVESLWVHRPFESEQIVTAGGASTRVVSRLGRQLLVSGGEPGVFEVAPQVAQFDQRVDVVASSVEAGDTRAVAGYRCRVLRTRRVLAADFAGRPTARDYVESCVTRDDIVLEETVVNAGRTASHAVARRVEVGGAALTHEFRTPGAHVPRAQGGGRILTLASDSRPPGQDFWELPAPPRGFTHVGRFAVVSPSAGTGGVVTSVDDVYVAGVDFVTVEQGETASGAAMAAPSGTPVTLGRLGRGKLHVSPIGSSVAVLTKTTGSFVRVTGTVAPSHLVALARALRAQPGGTLVTIADATAGGDA
ncbi:MAG TPA: hypothetical protein VHD87_17740 [Acidimicrobiales bacterium]|nr:hypothetical protein [Acidimicrobiales bacterium]